MQPLTLNTVRLYSQGGLWGMDHLMATAGRRIIAVHRKHLDANAGFGSAV